MLKSVCRTALAMLLPFASLSAQEPSPDVPQPNAALMIRAPQPRLAPKVVEAIQQTPGDHSQPLKVEFLIDVHQGSITRMRILNSSGIPALDSGISNWIQLTWQFKPNVSGTYTAPIEIAPSAFATPRPSPPK